MYEVLQKGKDATPVVKYVRLLQRILYAHFKLSFGIPKMDMCSTCDMLNIRIQDATEKQAA